MQLDLNDLKPMEASLVLSEHPGKTYTLKKLSLATQIWIQNRFGRDNIRTIFETQSLPEISEVAYFLIKDKTDFPTLLHFQESIVTQPDRVALMEAMLTTIGISQPVLNKMVEEDSGNVIAPPTGASTTTL